MDEAAQSALHVLASGQPNDRLDASIKLLTIVGRNRNVVRGLGADALLVFADNFSHRNWSVVENCVLLAYALVGAIQSIPRAIAVRLLASATGVLSSPRDSTREAARKLLARLLTSRDIMNTEDAFSVLFLGLSSSTPLVSSGMLEVLNRIYFAIDISKPGSCGVRYELPPYAAFRRFLPSIYRFVWGKNAEMSRLASYMITDLNREYKELQPPRFRHMPRDIATIVFDPVWVSYVRASFEHPYLVDGGHWLRPVPFTPGRPDHRVTEPPSRPTIVNIGFPG